MKQNFYETQTLKEVFKAKGNYLNRELIEYFQSYAKQKPVLDVRMLIVMNVFVSTLVLFSYRNETVIAAFVVSLVALILFNMFKQSFYYSLVFCATVAFTFWLPQINTINFLNIPARIIAVFAFFMGKILPFVMIAHIIFTKIPVNYLVASLRKMYLHKGLLLSLVVAIRYLPTAKKEFELIKDAMRLRGIEISFKSFIKSPLAIIEFSLVPLLFRNVTVAEQMSAAATVKGIEFEGKQSAVIAIQMGCMDYAFVVFAFIISVYSFWGCWHVDDLVDIIKRIAM